MSSAVSCLHVTACDHFVDDYVCSDIQSLLCIIFINYSIKIVDDAFMSNAFMCVLTLS